MPIFNRLADIFSSKRCASSSVASPSRGASASGQLQILLPILLAAIFWFIMFFPHLGLTFNFWLLMTISSLCLTLIALFLGGRPDVHISLGELLAGIIIAIVLWGVFWVGDKVSQWLFDFARPQVDLIYGIKGDTPPSLIALLLLFIIGPGEELFWRGYIQRRLSARWSPDIGFLVATAAYTLIHIPSLNFILVMAAMVCGIIWGGLFRLFPQHFTAIVVSHALWDAAAFVWFPF
ncbi:MAG: CPBP family intramembrane metalloprotease [Bacteroidaceae bacterium]|nr:CPBP family intramembrane metalloprotease [Bacteroidaceae bacterium]